MRKDIVDIKDMKEVYEQAFKQVKQEVPTKTNETVIDWMPEVEKKSFPTYFASLVPSSIHPFPIARLVVLLVAR